MIHYRDFAPRRTPGGLLRSDHYESFDTAVTAANAWISESKVELISLETVVLPNLWSRNEVGTTDASVETQQAMTAVNEWNQFLRVWYHDQ